MKTTSSKAATAAIAVLSLCAVFGVAHAELVYVPPVSSDPTDLMPSFRDEEREEQARALAERRQEMIADCEQNNGTDCEREVDTELRAEGLQSGARVIRLRPTP